MRGAAARLLTQMLSQTHEPGYGHIQSGELLPWDLGGRTPLFPGDASLGNLQVQADTFSINQHEAGIDELLAGDVKLFIGPEHIPRENELNGFAIAL